MSENQTIVNIILATIVRLYIRYIFATTVTLAGQARQFGVDYDRS